MNQEQSLVQGNRDAFPGGAQEENATDAGGGHVVEDARDGGGIDAAIIGEWRDHGDDDAGVKVMRDPLRPRGLITNDETRMTNQI